MSLFCRVIQADDLQDILDLENKKLTEAYPDEMERMMAGWSSKFRVEALNHYIPLGWSFLARDVESGKLMGYFIAQPLLFLDGQTQSLWVEHVQYSSLQARDELCELAYKLGREKHLQRVYFPNDNGVPNSIKAFKSESWQPGTLSVKTTKG
ncbi:hypothetical protein [Bdellovibrio bacteriovorus]|uniref:N-acetyltransferase domain-containing protein n=1 Tax=Bdellovibrio bacteriovorus TaxID=959 RepID=A0A150WC84_BDEBC|nr:hypothetical protein [Bdellovibrio bacteriovorus]KYG60674.1 hypothetical protein AZI85_11795 [Bdellovibrio bacteriovorus]KYG69125.1 hypothetical protein AZI87_07860 [Bdellovibrio bacteriovorus]